MQKICSILVVGALVICGVVRMNSQESEHEVNLKIVSLIEERFWLQSQRAEKKIPPEHKEDFRALLRVVLTDTEDGEKTRTAFEEFRKKEIGRAHV